MVMHSNMWNYVDSKAIFCTSVVWGIGLFTCSIPDLKDHWPLSKIKNAKGSPVVSFISRYIIEWDGSCKEDIR